MKLLLLIACAVLGYMLYTKTQANTELQTQLTTVQTQLATAQSQLAQAAHSQPRAVPVAQPFRQPAPLPAPTLNMNAGGLNSPGNSDMDRPHPAR